MFYSLLLNQQKIIVNQISLFISITTIKKKKHLVAVNSKVKHLIVERGILMTALVN